MCERTDQQAGDPQQLLHQLHRRQLQDQLDVRNGEPVKLLLLLDQLGKLSDWDGQPIEGLLPPVDQLEGELDGRDGQTVVELLLPDDQLELQQLDQSASGSAGQLGSSGL